MNSDTLDIRQNVELNSTNGGTYECRAVIEKCDDNTFSAFVENLPGVISCGDTFEQAERNIQEAFRLAVEEYRSLDQSPPFEDPPRDLDDCEGQQRWFVVNVG